MPIAPSRMRRLRNATMAALAVSADPGSSSLKGCTPTTTSPPNTVTTAIASSDERPSSLQ
jgi:hypothetical protein